MYTHTQDRLPIFDFLAAAVVGLCIVFALGAKKAVTAEAVQPVVQPTLVTVRLMRPVARVLVPCPYCRSCRSATDAQGRPEVIPVFGRIRHAVAPYRYNLKYANPQEVLHERRCPGCSRCPKLYFDDRSGSWKPLAPTATKSPTLPEEAAPTPAPAVKPAPAKPLALVDGKLQQGMLAGLNKIRMQEKKPPLVLNERLCVAAQRYADFCAKNGGEGHEADGSTPEKRANLAGYPNRGVGELKAVGHATVPEVILAWTDPVAKHKHKKHDAKVLVGRWTDIGVGVGKRGGLPVVWVVNFGNPGK